MWSSLSRVEPVMVGLFAVLMPRVLANYCSSGSVTERSCISSLPVCFLWHLCFVSCCLVPVQHPQGAQRVPPTRLTLGHARLRVQLVGMHVL